MQAAHFSTEGSLLILDTQEGLGAFHGMASSPGPLPSGSLSEKGHCLGYTPQSPGGEKAPLSFFPGL